MPTLNELLRAASRTFAIGIELLPEPLRGEIEVAYLLLRISDYLEDNESMEPQRKAVLLELWADVLAGRADVKILEAALADIRDDTPDALVARNTGLVHRALHALVRQEARSVIERHVRDSTLGMARWSRRGPDIAGEAELDDYMHEVAGRVGWLLTELFALDVPAVGRNREAMMRLGREFGLGLQTVNVIRGLHSDWQRGWVFIPRSFLAEHGADPGALFAAGERDPALEAVVLERLVRKADGHLTCAGRYILSIPRAHHRIRLFCLLPYLFAVRTLALSRGNGRVFQSEIKVPRSEIRRIAGAARLLGWSNGWVKLYAARLARGQGAESSPRPRD